MKNNGPLIVVPIDCNFEPMIWDEERNLYYSKNSNEVYLVEDGIVTKNNDCSLTYTENDEEVEDLDNYVIEDITSHKDIPYNNDRSQIDDYDEDEESFDDEYDSNNEEYDSNDYIVEDITPSRDTANIKKDEPKVKESSYDYEEDEDDNLPLNNKPDDDSDYAQKSNSFHGELFFLDEFFD